MAIPDPDFCIYCGDIKANTFGHLEGCPTNRDVPADMAELFRKPTPAEPHMAGPSGLVSPKDLRDEFAMAALTGLLSHGQFLPNEWESKASVAAYKCADAMIKARKIQHEEIPPEKRGECVAGILPKQP